MQTTNILLALLLVLVIYSLFFNSVKKYQNVSSVNEDLNSTTLRANQVVDAVLIVNELTQGSAAISFALPNALAVIQRMRHSSVSQTFQFTIVNRKTTGSVTVTDNALITYGVAAKRSQDFTGIMISYNGFYMWPSGPPGVLP